MIAEKEVELISTRLHFVSDKIWKVALFGPDNYKGALITIIYEQGKGALKNLRFNLQKNCLLVI